jgi:hypothetical protein
MKMRFLILAATFVFCFSVNLDAQTKNDKQPLGHVIYNSNVDAPLTFQEKQMLQEVYGDKLEAYVLSNPQKLKTLKNILRNRVEVKLISNPRDQKDCTLLSQVSLFNYYNENLSRGNFDVNNFNPLKYNFNFYARGTSLYRVDNTNYFIVIKSQHQ